MPIPGLESCMASEIKSIPSTRRYARVHGPFDADHLDTPRTPVLVYDLNLGGGFVHFGDEQPKGATLTLKIELPREGPITVSAEAIYRDTSGVAVRFVDVDRDTASRIARTVEAMTERSF
jgi:hypothetical protein